MAQKMDCVHDQKGGSNQKDPRKDLLQGEGIPNQYCTFRRNKARIASQAKNR
jgi:hypothetical protein